MKTVSFHMPQRLADMKASVDAWVGDGVEQQPAARAETGTDEHRAARPGGVMTDRRIDSRTSGAEGALINRTRSRF